MVNLAEVIGQQDIPGSIGRAQSMAANTMNLQDAQQQRQQQQQLSGIQQQAVDSGYDPETHKQLLMDAGFFEEAMDLEELQSKQVKNKQDAAEKGLNLISKTAELVKVIGAPAWPTLRSSLIQAGMADEQSLPVEYDEQAAMLAHGVSQRASDVAKVIKFRSGDQEQDIMLMNGKVIKGKPYAADTGKGSELTALQKNVPFLARTMNITEDQAAKILTQSREQTDADIYKSLYTAALRSTYGDSEEASKIAKEALQQVQQYKAVPGSSSSSSSQGSAGGGQYQEGKIYQDAQGNKARYVNGQWEPVQ